MTVVLLVAPRLQFIFSSGGHPTSSTPRMASRRSRADIPDETWLLSTEHDPRYAHPLLVGARTYYDHAQEFRGAVGWQVDPISMTITRLP
jgi:hypothetical protein